MDTYILEIVVGIVVGIILFVLYKKLTVEYHGGNSSVIKNTIYKDEKNNKCYVFEPKVFVCG